jgi:hypothetical protein
MVLAKRKSVTETSERVFLLYNAPESATMSSISNAGQNKEYTFVSSYSQGEGPVWHNPKPSEVYWVGRKELLTQSQCQAFLISEQ